MDNIEDIFQLTPIQSGLLFESLYGADDEFPSYVVQDTLEMTEAVDYGCLRAAWEHVHTRHATLRSAFLWEGLAAPVQVVQRQVGIAVHRLDWSREPAERLTARLADFLRQDRRRPFDISRAPLYRVTVIEHADRGFMVLTSHHLLLDARSTEIVVNEVHEAYRAMVDGRPANLPEVVPYARYVESLSGRPRGEADDFWRTYMAGFGEASRFSAATPSVSASPGEIKIVVPEHQTADLATFCRRHHVTPNTMIQGVLGVALAHHCGCDDVMF
jgi:hypothetical protein